MSLYIPEALRQWVFDRAHGCCEYCLMAEEDTFLIHELDHIISIKHGGETTPDNLALACFYCNRYKGTDIASLDPVTGALTPLFNPRTHLWSEHFRLDEWRIKPLTPEGRVTERVLQLNHPDRQLERRLLLAEGRYPLHPF